MKTLIPPTQVTVMALLVLGGIGARAAESVASTNTSPLRRTDANGNPLRRAPTGHISNYDEAKVGQYTLPDPLVLQNGKPVRDADTWFKQRRPELLRLYRSEIYGRVPDGAPKVRFEVAEIDTNAMNGTAVRKEIVGHFGDKSDGAAVHVHLYLPAKASQPVPVLLHLVFFNATPPSLMASATDSASRPRMTETGPIADMLARGYGYATVRYTEIEGDSASGNMASARKLALAPGQAKPAPDEWGTISAWAWGTGRLIDYFETDAAVDAKRIAVIGHSRLGKTALWLGAQDPRVALVFASCSGEMGASLARRDFGETVDDMAANFPWWFAGNFQKYAGHWNDMPVDTHMLIALNAPHPVFVTGGTEDQWADPRGEFLAEVAAGPVYRLVGKKDLGTSEFPPTDTPLLTGELAFNYHTGEHTITATEWKNFLDFADRQLKSTH